MHAAFRTNANGARYGIDGSTNRKGKLTSRWVSHKLVEVISEAARIGDVLELVIE